MAAEGRNAEIQEPYVVEKYRDLKECATIGIALAKAGRQNMWDAGEWYVHARAQFGVAAINRLVTRPGWEGYSSDTLKTYASIVRNFPPVVEVPQRRL